MCGLLKRQVVYYIMCLLNYRTFLQNNTSLVSVIAPSCVGKLWNEMSHISCPIHPNHLLNWLWTSAQLSRFTGYLCICELLHWLCCWTPAVYACVCVCVRVFPHTFFPPCMSVCKSVCGPFLCKIWNTHTVSLTLLLICSQYSGGGLGPVEEKLGRRSWGSPKVLLKGNSSGFSPPLNSCHLLDAHI